MSQPTTPLSSKTWAFCLTTSAIRSRIHLFPSAGGVAGHYPVNCQLTIFGKGIERRSVRLEGGRINQPDGIRLEDAFPTLLNEGVGLCGLEISFECANARINLSPSRVVVELVSPALSLSYLAAPFVSLSHPQGVNVRDQRVAVGILIQDANMSPSLIVVNHSEGLYRPEYSCVTRSGETALQLGSVAPLSVVEFSLEESLFKHSLPRELVSGVVKFEKIWCPEVEAPTDSEDLGVSSYILYRDPLTKRPVSVCAL